MALLSITHTDDEMNTTSISMPILEPGATEFARAMAGFMQLLTYHPSTVALAMNEISEELMPPCDHTPTEEEIQGFDEWDRYSQMLDQVNEADGNREDLDNINSV